MTKEEILEKIKELKAKRDYILESHMQLLGIEPIGYVWRLRFDNRKQYLCEIFEEIKKEVGADDAFIQSRRGLWLHLYIYTKEQKQ